jgi:hypothetical protein
MSPMSLKDVGSKVFWFLCLPSICIFLMIYMVWTTQTHIALLDAANAVRHAEIEESMRALKAKKLAVEEHFRRDMALLHLYHPGSAGAGTSSGGLTGTQDEPEELVGFLKMLYTVAEPEPEPDGVVEADGAAEAAALELMDSAA